MALRRLAIRSLIACPELDDAKQRGAQKAVSLALSESSALIMSDEGFENGGDLLLLTTGKA